VWKDGWLRTDLSSQKSHAIALFVAAIFVHTATLIIGGLPPESPFSLALQDRFPTNPAYENEFWSGFLPGYIGGIAWLIVPPLLALRFVGKKAAWVVFAFFCLAMASDRFG